MWRFHPPVTAGCMVLLLAVSTACAAEQNRAVSALTVQQAAVARVEQQWLEALERADVGAIAALLADDFVRPAPQAGAFIGKAELLDYYRAHLVRDTTHDKHIGDLRIAVYGETSVARGKLVTTDAAGHVTAQLLFTDVFVRRNGRWLAVSAQENPVPAQKP